MVFFMEGENVRFIGESDKSKKSAESLDDDCGRWTVKERV
jgi:hypothetical protein